MRRDAGSGLQYSPAIDGLRGIAVAAVVAYHFDWIPGGFLGVDAFFVLSGFLITTLLLEEHARGRRIGLPAFWARRARRLLPALLLLLVVLVVFARNATPRADVLGALAYVANWQQIWTDASYFSAFAEPSPLKHVWSLAVEEQFYLLWPVVVLAALRIGGRRALIALCTGGILVSVLLMAVWYAPTDPSRVYYGTDTRAHLLLVGALLALVPAERLRVASSARGQVLGALALAIGVAAMLVVDDQSAFLYRGGMFLNALLVAGVLASVAYQPGTRLARALGVAPLRGLGGISYGVYLWSWPVIVLVTTDRTGLDGAALVALQLALIVAVPLLSYRLLEQPVRRWRPRPMPVLAGALAAAVAMGVAAVVVVPKPALDPVFATAGPDLADFEPVAAPPVTAPPVTAPPVTAPPVTAGPPATVAPPATEPNPTTTVALRALRPPHRIAIVGDSVAASLAFGFDAVAREFGIEVVKRAYPGCGVAVAIPLGQDGKRVEWGEACANVGAVLDDLVARRDPDVVVWLSTLDTVDREENGVPLQWGTDEHRAALLAAMDTQVARLTSRGARVVFIAPPFPAPGRLNLQLPEKDQQILRDYRALLIAYTTVNADRSAFVEIDDLVCPTGYPCPQEVGGTDLRPDGTHFSEESAPIIARQLLPRVLETAAAPPSLP